MALEAFVGSISVELAALAGHYLHGSLGVAWGLKGELKKLERLLEKIKDVLADAEEKQIGNAAVSKWLDALKKTAYEAEDVVDQFNYQILRHKAAKIAEAAGINNSMVPRGKVRDFFSSHNQILFRLKMGRKLKNILKRIEEIESESKEFNFVVKYYAQPETTQPMRETISLVESDVVGRDENREEIVSMLINNSSEKLAVLPIVGMGGVGKTTMAQLIYNDPRVVNHFQLCAWVCVSEEWDMRKIIQNLIASVTSEKCELPTLELQQRTLREALIGKRHLIVLDDIWNEEPSDWDTLRVILDCGGGNGSAIIVTTRSNNVAKITGTLPSYDLPCLSEDESWSLFSSKSFASGAEKPQELVDIGKEIVRKCGGLPLAIMMVGSSLYMKTDRNYWLAFRDSYLWKMENNKILPALRLSYKHLPPLSKRCFAFCATFPKDYLIEKETLIQMWMAHGFIPSGDRSIVKGREIFDDLVQRSFLHDLKQREKDYTWFRFTTLEKHEDDLNDPFIVTSCKMHDLVHDLAQSIVRDECKALYNSSLEEDATPKDVYHLSTSWFNDFDNKEIIKAFTNLRTFMECFDMGEVTGNFPQYTLLRVLRLQSSSFIRFPTMSSQHLRHLQLTSGKIEELPDSIGTLHHLQTLDLSRCYVLRKLPESICTLPNLQTMYLCECMKLCELPKRMQCMTGLRNLYLDRCYSLRTMPAGMGKMTKLETLTMYLVSNEDGRGIQELKGLNLSSKLEIYNLRHVQDAEEARQVNLHAKDLQWLTLCWREVDYVLSSNYNDADINYLNGERVLEELKPGDGLKILKIWDYSGLKFPEWTMGCLHLVQLHLGYCTRFQGLPPLWRLNSLEFLSLRRLDSLKYIISGDDDAAGDTTAHAFPSLETLILCSLWSLEGWWGNDKAVQKNCFPSLWYLEITKCPQLTGSIPLLSCLKSLKLEESNRIRLGYFLPNETSSLRHHHLQCLECLTITKCEEAALTWRDQEEVEMTGFGSCLKHMYITECDWLFSSRRSGLWRCMTSSLETLTIYDCHALVDLFEVLQGLKSLRRLQIFYRVPEATTFTIDARLPPQLQELRFSSSESLKTIMLRCPASLKSLGIGDCPNLVSLTAAAEQELGDLTSLQEIIIVKCNSLKSLSALRELLIEDCTELTSLPECLLQCLPNLEDLLIRGCPELEKKCTSGGEYYHLVSNIPKTSIGRKEISFTTKFLNFLCHRR